MCEWLKSNRIRGSKQLECPTCRKPARESDLGRMFVETVVLNEDTDRKTKTRLVDTIMEQINSLHGFVRAITPTSNAVQVNRAMLSVVRAQDVISKSQHAKNELMVKAVMDVSLHVFRRAPCVILMCGGRN